LFDGADEQDTGKEEGESTNGGSDDDIQQGPDGGAGMLGRGG
jgi:hypothetical protein